MDNKDNENVLAGLSKPFPRNAIKQRQGGGGKMLDYIETHTAIRRLNRVCGEWSWKINNVDVRGNLFILTGTLTIPGLGSRDGIGVQQVTERGGEDLVKGASSDALKKAATLFGMAIELYGPDYEGGQDEQRRQSPPQREQPRNQAPQQDNRDKWNQQGNPNEDGWTAARKGFREIAYTYGHILPPLAQREVCKEKEVALVLELLGPDTKLQYNGWPFGGTYEEAARAIEEIARRGDDRPTGDDFEDTGGPFNE
jgi:hypothetical protein